MSNRNNPVFYHPGGKSIYDDNSDGEQAEGWYWWAEDWCRYYGPFPTEEESNRVFLLYFKELVNMNDTTEIDTLDLSRLQIIDLAARAVMSSAKKTEGTFDVDALDILKQALATPSTIRGLYWFGKMPESRLK